jgi:uncharacterized membrane protein YecN with MAPEG domain
LLGVLLRLAFAASVEGANAFILSAVNGIWLSGRVLFVLGYSENNPMGRELGLDAKTVFSFLAYLSCHRIRFDHV